jgi:hypothetical protein
MFSHNATFYADIRDTSGCNVSLEYLEKLCDDIEEEFGKVKGRAPTDGELIRIATEYLRRKKE